MFAKLGWMSLVVAVMVPSLPANVRAEDDFSLAGTYTKDARCRKYTLGR